MILGLPKLTIAQESSKDSMSWFQRHREKKKVKAIENAEKYDNYTVLGMSLSHNTIQDTKMAPSIYSGPGIGIRHDMIQLSETAWMSSKFEGTYAIPGREGWDGNYTNVNIKYQFLYTKKVKKHPNLYLGASMDFLNQFKLYTPLGNSAVNNDLVVGLQPVAMLRKERKILKRNSIAYTRMGFNLLSYVNRYPTYNVGSRELNYFISPIGVFNRFRFELGFNTLRKWSNENRVGLEYSWDFYAMNELDKQFKVRAAQHMVTFNFYLKTR